MKIHSHCGLPFKLLFGGDRFSPIHPQMNTDKGIFLSRGKAAIWHIIDILGISGDENILVPAFHCESVVDPILDRKVNVKFYKITTSLLPDIADIKAKIDEKTRALLIIHFLGFPQPIYELKKFCNQRGIFLIEDCAHALFSEIDGKFLGSFGDLSLFTMYKTLPIPNGAFLQINNADIPIPDMKIRNPPFLVVLINLLDACRIHLDEKEKWDARLISYFLRFSQVFLKVLWLPQIYLYEKKYMYKGMSKVAMRIMKNINPEEVIASRRSNFLYLLRKTNELEGVQPVFKVLPESVCPWFFPVFVDKRDRICDFLKKKNIDAVPLWNSLRTLSPKEEFPDSLFLSTHLLLLPVSQDLGQPHMRRLITVLKEALQNLIGAQ